MLSYLRIRGLALLEDVTIELGAGMTILTGETGAGKSIIVDALSLVRGARARADLVRDGAAAAEVEACFEVDDEARGRIAPLLEEHGVPPVDHDGLTVRRVVSAGGRGRCFVQSTLTTRAVLAELGEHLVDICSQHEHHFLTRVARHLDLLDAYAGHEADVQRHTVDYRAWRDELARLSDLRARSGDAVARADYLRFQIDELERVAPDRGEHDALRRRVELLREGQRWATFAEHARDVLYEGDGAVAGRLGVLLEDARRGSDGSTALAELAEQLVTAQVACEEAAHVAARLAGEVDVEPGDLDRAETRLSELESLRRKHGVDPEELPERLDRMRSELDELAHAGEEIARLEASAAKLESRCREQARRLTDARRRAVTRISRAIEGELRALHLPDASVELELSGAELGPRGADRAQMLFSANPGESPAPLSRVASGGELSRVLLAIKGALASGSDAVATYVFDEVDAGVGGAVAEAIGRRLAAAATDRQVLCITHLPQIAAFAGTHLRVDKTSRGGRTVASVARLSEEQRVDELARMLGGARVTKSAREHAGQLIRDARKQGRARKRRAPRAERARGDGAKL